MKINKEYRLAKDALVAYVFASQDVTHPEIRLGRTATQKISQLFFTVIRRTVNQEKIWDSRSTIMARFPNS